VEVPSGEVLGVPAVDQGEDWAGLVVKQRVDHAAGDAAVPVLGQDDQRGELPTAGRVSPYLRDADGRAAGLGDDEPRQSRPRGFSRACRTSRVIAV
jgi:hypothetical protein